jgi:surface carbohydrate biosynthesis protein
MILKTHFITNKFFTLKKLFYFLKYLLTAKWNFKLPKKNRYVLVDGDYNPFTKYIKKKNFTILYRRGEELNFYIIFKCLVKLKFSTLEYCAEFIKHVSPKLILTAFDYHIIFYKLSKKTGIKTLMLQKGQRGGTEVTISNRDYFFPKSSKKKFHVDYVLLFNDTVRKFYSKRINGNFFDIGSFENNFKKINFKRQKKEIVFISNYSHRVKDKCENEDTVAFFLNELAEKNNIRFNILPRYRNNPKILIREKIFYNKVLKDNSIFILDKKKTSYELLLNYKFIFSTYSTLANEFFAKGARVGFIMFKSSKNSVYSYRFGSFFKLKIKGLFWTCFSKLNIEEINRVFNFVIKTNHNTWNKKTKYYKKKIMNFDYGNKTFRKIIKKF